jgi:hypothetical protein
VTTKDGQCDRTGWTSSGTTLGKMSPRSAQNRDEHERKQ